MRLTFQSLRTSENGAGISGNVYDLQNSKGSTLCREKRPWPQRFQSFFISIRMKNNAYNHENQAENKQANAQSQWESFKEITDNAADKNSLTDVVEILSNNFELLVPHQCQAYHTEESLSTFIVQTGNVGIGTTNPGAQLDLSTDLARKLTTTTWQTGSDARIKTKVQSINNALEIIRRLRPVKFHYTPKFLAAHPSVKDTDYYNFIAQEYQKVFPISVTESNGLLYLNSSFMIPYAIAGIKELDLKVQELTQENQELKERVDALEKKAGK